MAESGPVPVLPGLYSCAAWWRLAYVPNQHRPDSNRGGALMRYGDLERVRHTSNLH